MQYTYSIYLYQSISKLKKKNFNLWRHFYRASGGSEKFKSVVTSLIDNP